MPKILITGNGFDLNFGLPTAYSDFINILKYVLENSEIEFNSIYSQTSNFKKISEIYKPYELELESIHTLKNDIEKNLWFKFFKDEYQIETWIDFENKIEYVLNNLFKSINQLEEKLFSKGSIYKNELFYTTELFSNNFEVIKVLENFGIISLDENFSITLQEKYLIEKYDFFIDINIDEITKMLISQLNEFKHIFNSYFQIFIFPLYNNFKAKIDRSFFSSIYKHYTFNYTPTFEKFYRKNCTNYLHGKVNNLENELVLGISEIPENELDQKYFLPFTKYFQKLDNETDYKFIQEFENKRNVNFMFLFYGHSLDKSDEDYINEVFDFISSLKNKKNKIVVGYHNQKSKSQLLINLLSIRGKKNIQELMKVEKLIFVDINTNELKKELNRDISNSTTSYL